MPCLTAEPRDLAISFLSTRQVKSLQTGSDIRDLSPAIFNPLSGTLCICGYQGIAWGMTSGEGISGVTRWRPARPFA
jgi:hypothetical protein